MKRKGYLFIKREGNLFRERNKSHSIFYRVLAITLLLALAHITYHIGVVYNASLSWYEHTDYERYFSFPIGTPYHKTDTHGGFHGDGVTTIVAQIPPESAQDFVQILWEKGFTDTPMPKNIRQEISYVHEVNGITDISNGLWWFRDGSPTGHEGDFTDYTFHMYDLDTCTYYYIEYDS